MTKYELCRMLITVAKEGDEAGINACIDALREDHSESSAEYVEGDASEPRDPLAKRHRLIRMAGWLADRVASELTQDVSAALKAIRDSCDHRGGYQFHQGSGNNDSWTECLICGAEV
jgi:hypothetical protein